MTGNRIKYIDVAKGFLIIFVVLGHITSTTSDYGNIHDNYFNQTGYLLSTFYVPFYMQAFFFITGYTTNFQKPFLLFLKQNVKRLVLPYVCFGFIYALFNHIVFGQNLLFTTMDGEKLFFLVEFYWFLSALFISKILFWFISRVENFAIQLLLCLLLFLIGWGISAYYAETTNFSHLHNYFHYRIEYIQLYLE